MFSYFIRRLFFVVFVAWGVTFATFFIANVVPIDPAIAALGDNAREEQIQEFRERYGLDKPIWQQYLIYMGRLITGDLGNSLRTQRAVVEDLKEFFPATLELSVAAFLVTLLLGVPAGILAALRQNKASDVTVRILALIGGATPVFFLAVLLQFVFARQLDLLPVQGRLDGFAFPPPRVTGMVGIDSLLARDWAAFLDSLRHLLPNTLTPIFVQASFDVGGAILTAAGLSFIGFGAQPPTPEWGAMVSETRSYIAEAIWAPTAPAIGILLTVLAFNLLGDALRDVFDPRGRD